VPKSAGNTVKVGDTDEQVNAAGLWTINAGRQMDIIQGVAMKNQQRRCIFVAVILNFAAKFSGTVH